MINECNGLLAGRSSLLPGCDRFQQSGWEKATSSCMCSSLACAVAAGMWSFARITAGCIPIAIAVSDCVASIIKVEGQSMHPCIKGGPPQADYVLVEKLSSKWLHEWHRGAVYLLWAPDNPHQQLVKRLIGLEGDLVWDQDSKSPVTIPQGRCWIEGDNASHSGDSRNLFGPVHLGLIEGRVTHIVWPPSRICRVAPYVPVGRVVPEDKAHY